MQGLACLGAGVHMDALAGREGLHDVVDLGYREILRVKATGVEGVDRIDRQKRSGGDGIHLGGSCYNDLLVALYNYLDTTCAVDNIKVHDGY